MKNKIKGKTTPKPVRFSAKADFIVKSVMANKGFAKYNFTVNWIIEQHNKIEAWQEEQRKRIQGEMDLVGLRPGDFILIDKKKKELE